MNKIENTKICINGKEHNIPHLLERVFYDPIEQAFVVSFGTLKANYYSRRNIQYDIGINCRFLYINKSCKPLENKNKDDSITYVQENWLDFIQLGYHHLYEKEISLSKIIKSLSISEATDDDELHNNLSAIFNQWEEIIIYNGYNSEITSPFTRKNCEK